jgi:catechol 2,3-dioxygenase-like lactoylglutathione lyase family enzyme
MNNPRMLFPMVVTDKLTETKKFYIGILGFDVRIEMEGYLQVRSGSEEGDPEIAFMAPGKMPDGTEFEGFTGKGLVLSVPTRSADEKAAALRKAGLGDVKDPTDKPWGWRSFLTRDPNGVTLDFFHVVAENPMLPSD